MAKQSFVTLSDGTKVLVRLLGESDDKRPLIIALHGAPGLSSHAEPENSFGFLASRFHVLVYDGRGSGESDSKAPLTNERWIADLDEIRAWAREETFILAGGSYGGLLALGYTLTHPHRVRALILRDTWAYGPRAALHAINAIARSADIETDTEQQIRLWSGAVRDNRDFETGVNAILPMYTAKKHGPISTEKDENFEKAKTTYRYETHNAAFAHSLPRIDLRSRLGEIQAPTLVVVGRHDPVTPVQESQEIHDRIKGSVLAIFENSGHSPPSEEPELFQEKLWHFLDQF
ncbi:hypothetical protein NLG97_g209 [Lecanicillium saksenae]|uniref:Uncharacterized protein n=1 Tax=Lecanicillium saksenae TaxID=468837 RepID=A0ACC1R7D4_9HYPO|nr:hypothetical protein NLG97_g209 [Lecanicillium saksenae]